MRCMYLPGTRVQLGTILPRNCLLKIKGLPAMARHRPVPAKNSIAARKQSGVAPGTFRLATSLSSFLSSLDRLTSQRGDGWNRRVVLSSNVNR